MQSLNDKQRHPRSRIISMQSAPSAHQTLHGVRRALRRRKQFSYRHPLPTRILPRDAAIPCGRWKQKILFRCGKGFARHDGRAQSARFPMTASIRFQQDKAQPPLRFPSLLKAGSEDHHPTPLGVWLQYSRYFVRKQSESGGSPRFLIPNLRPAPFQPFSDPISTPLTKYFCKNG